jgi:hypothetical protein
MWLRALAGAYAGQIRDFRTDVGIQALRSGTAERVTLTESTPLKVLSVHAADQMAQAAVIVSAEKKRKGRPAVETTAAKR